MEGFILTLFCVVVLGSPTLDNRGYYEKVGIPLVKAIRENEHNILDMVPRVRSKRIVGGMVAPRRAHPYLASLLIHFPKKTRPSVCGASIVSTRHLVSAAHCWSNGTLQATKMTVVLGSPFLYRGGIRTDTSTVVMHPRYNAATLDNDVAVIYLHMRIHFSYQTEIPKTAQVNQVNLLIMLDCQNVYSVDLPHTICTSGEGGVGPCHGDSGGPLVYWDGKRNVLVGIASSASKYGCQVGRPATFTRVSSFYNFIVKNLGYHRHDQRAWELLSQT